MHDLIDWWTQWYKLHINCCRLIYFQMKNIYFSKNRYLHFKRAKRLSNTFDFDWAHTIEKEKIRCDHGSDTNCINMPMKLKCYATSWLNPFLTHNNLLLLMSCWFIQMNVNNVKTFVCIWTRDLQSNDGIRFFYFVMTQFLAFTLWFGANLFIKYMNAAL